MPSKTNGGRQVMVGEAHGVFKVHQGHKDHQKLDLLYTKILHVVVSSHQFRSYRHHFDRKRRMLQRNLQDYHKLERLW